MTTQLIDDILGDTKEYNKVTDFIKLYPSAKDILSDSNVMEKVIRILANEDTLSNYYILLLIYRVGSLSNKFDIGFDKKELIKNSIVNSRYHSVYNTLSNNIWAYTYLPYHHLRLEQLKPIVFDNVYNAFRRIGSVESNSSLKIADNKLSLAAFKNCKNSIHSYNAIFYLKEVYHYKNTKEEYIDYILSKTKHTKKLKKHIANSFNGSSGILSDFDFTSTYTPGKYINLVPSRIFSYACSRMALPSIMYDREYSRIDPIIVGTDMLTKLDIHNYKVWIAYIQIFIFYSQNSSPKPKGVDRILDYLINEVKKPEYKNFSKGYEISDTIMVLQKMEKILWTN